MNQPFRIAIVGAGGISRLHLEGIRRHRDRVRTVALCDPDPSALDARRREFDVAECCTGLDELIAKVRPDAAIVCTPTHVRKDVVIPLIEAGIPVLCEKPFAETYAEAALMAQAAESTGTPLAVNQNFRRHFTFALGRAILKEGRLGEPLHLVQVAHMLRRDAGWRLERRRYVMSVMSIHWFDGYRYLLDDEPASVCCFGVNSPATEGGEDTAASVLLQFTKGTVVSLSESFSSFTRPYLCSLDCEAGGLEMGYEKLIEFGADGSRSEHRNPCDKVQATYLVLEELLEATAKGRRPETSAADNLNSMRILEAAYRSLAENRMVRVEEVQ